MTEAALDRRAMPASADETHGGGNAWLMRPRLKSRRWRVGLLLLGLVVPQVLLFGQSLAGKRVLLPLALLTQPSMYLPRTEPYTDYRPANTLLSDQILSYEIERQFVAREFRAGRIPLWDPNHYLGAPFVNWPKYAPFALIYYAFPHWWTLAWIQLIKSVVAGAGAYLFFRRVLQVDFLPAAIGGWCYPLTGFFMLWQGFPQTYVLAWMPWMMLLTDGAFRRPGSWFPPGLALMTCILLISGQLDSAGHVLIACGCYVLCLLVDRFRSPAWVGPVLTGTAAAAAGWALGFVLSAPEILPLVEYASGGERLKHDVNIMLDRPPQGIESAPQIVMPEFYGSTRAGSVRAYPLNIMESSAAAYVGLLATLLAAPLALLSRRHRAMNAAWLWLVLIGLSWPLKIWPFWLIFRLPLLDLRPHNRVVCVAAFGLLALAVTGLQVLREGSFRPRWWFAFPIGALAIAGAIALSGAFQLSDSLAMQIERILAVESQHTTGLYDEERVRVEQSFQAYFGIAAAWSALTYLFWGVLLSGRWPHWHARLVPLLGLLFLAELFYHGCRHNVEASSELYYPPLPAVERLKEHCNVRDYRCVGIYCLPPKLTEAAGLRDIRGYDGVDPPAVVQLLRLAREKKLANASPGYAKTLLFLPATSIDNFGRMRVSPILDMLSVRYLIQRYAPLKTAVTLIRVDDYYVFENENALPRAFVPLSTQVTPVRAHVLRLMQHPRFNPRLTAFVPEALGLPPVCQGVATIVEENPHYVRIQSDMKTAGLVVLSDLWTDGWHATINGAPAPVIRTNYCLRGVKAPAGVSTIEYRYEPASFNLGVQLLFGGLVITGCWLLAIFLLRRKHAPAAQARSTRACAD